MTEIRDKQVLITGGSSGIGLALAMRMARAGAHTWILARRRPELEVACREISAARLQPNQQVGIIQADVANREQIFKLLGDHVATHGAPDVLVNNAGITYPGTFAEQPLEIFDNLMRVNYEGTLNVTKAVLPAMIARRSGHIAFVGSMAGVAGVYGYSAYGASKFALRGLADVLRVELREHNIRTSLILPTDTQTPQLEFEKDLKPAMTAELVGGNTTICTPEEVANIIYKGITRDKYIITTGGDALFFYLITNTFGVIYPISDFLFRQAERRLRRRAQNNGGK